MAQGADNKAKATGPKGLHNLRPAKGSVRDRKRVGRGPGSGRGKTAGRGEKGQMSRSGSAHKLGFEGGQMPLHRRVPKRGFHNLFRKEYACINVGRLEEFEPGTIVTPEVLQQRGTIKALQAGLKVLGHGELTKALTVRAHKFSAKALEVIQKVGGKAEVIERAPRAEA
jgi:large subunit ribosomal protein L15